MLGGKKTKTTTLKKVTDIELLDAYIWQLGKNKAFNLTHLLRTKSFEYDESQILRVNSILLKYIDKYAGGERALNSEGHAEFAPFDYSYSKYLKYKKAIISHPKLYKYQVYFTILNVILTIVSVILAKTDNKSAKEIQQYQNVAPPKKE